MRESIKFKRRVDASLICLCIICIIAMFSMANVHEKELKEQEYLKSEMVADNDWLTKRNADLEKQIKLLEERVESQQATIDRLMKLETVQEVQSRGMSEGRSEPLIGQAAIIQSMLDRTDWGITVKEAIEAPGQYAPSYRGPVSEDMQTAFELVFLDGYRVFERETTHFHSDTVSPAWSRGKAFREKVGSHLFYGPEVQ